ncbi:glycoside hydrolase family 32 protein [Microbacterium sp. ZW CA_36]|uniref:glycoside hydrolase family 32 protein n=1 Tax=Microbacterium sp. ZW CA_36 TaxID=3378078 RepID=UPI003853EEEC
MTTHPMTSPNRTSSDLVELAAADPHRPAFHFVSPAGWLNDPNGLTQRDGWYHLFYQYNPYAPVHDRIHWGHARSTDLINWEHLPIALEPTAGPDVDGCWSGVFVDDGGVPTLVYSGRHGEVELPCVATGSDDLVEWTKEPGNPVVAAPPEDLDIVAFRDHCVWREQAADGTGGWRQIVGSGIRGVGGTALLYESDDLRSWRYVSPLLVGDAADRPRTASDWTGTMWECVDLFATEGADVLVFSAWDDGVTHHPLYWSGRYRGDRFEPRALHRLDLGGRFFYAPQSMRDETGRRLMFGWMQEGRTDAAAVAAGWSGVMSLPRVVTGRPDGSLHQAPAPEVDALRTELLYEGPAGEVGAAGIGGDQLDLELDATLPSGTSIELAVRATVDGAERTVYRLRRVGGEVEFSLDRSRSSLDDSVDATPLAGVVGLEGDTVRLRVVVDHSALEAFANGLPLAARAYPTRDDALRVCVDVGGAAATLRVWRMASVN